MFLVNGPTLGHQSKNSDQGGGTVKTLWINFSANYKLRTECSQTPISVLSEIDRTPSGETDIREHYK